MSEKAFDIMTSLSMEDDLPMSQAQAAIGHILARIRDDKTLGYLCGLGGETFGLLTEAFATLTCHSVKEVREEFLPRNAEDPRETFAPTPINSLNSYGEGGSALNETLFEEEEWVEYKELEAGVKALCESFASRECATAPHLASSAQHLAAIRAKLESEVAQ